MRLKLLFFPLMLVLSIFVIYRYVVPEMMEIGRTKVKVVENNDLLKAIREKRDSITALNNQLDTNKAQVDWVMKYLPTQKNEEDIVNEINFIAATSNVSLYSFTFQEPHEEVVVKNEEVVPSNMLTTGNVQSVATYVNDQSVNSTKIENLIRYSGAKIGVVGNYPSIKLFFQRLHDLELYNVIHDVNIQLAQYKDESKKDSGDLLAEVSVNFGYMETAKVQNNYAASIFEKKSYDLENIKSLKQRNSTTVPAIDMNTGVGKDNPFLP